MKKKKDRRGADSSFQSSSDLAATHTDANQTNPAASEPIASHDSGGRLLRYANLKVEAAIFLLIVMTFAALLGKSAITSQKLVLSPRSDQFVAYAFSDTESGGHSSVSADPLKPLSWSCKIRDGAPYPYCGYGMQLDVGRKDEGQDFSHFKTITLRFTYRGSGDHLKLIVKTALPASLHDKAGDDALPLAMEFPVVNGRNEIRLPIGELAAEQWWVTNHGFSPREATPAFDNVRAVAISTSGATAASDIEISVDDITFEGSYLSAEQWYLIILGVWLVLTGGFLVHRFFRMRHSYEARQRRQARETRLLAKAHAATEAASSAKSQFLGNMSHELRTPLNAIMGYAYWLSRGDLSAKQREAVETIQTSSEHLLAMITDILDVAKIEAGKLELFPAPFDLRDCVDGVSQMFRLRAEEKDLRFAVSVAQDVPRMIVADQKRVRQVLINLLGNAVKFTSNGQVGLQVSVLSQMDDAIGLRFVVEDTGIGIPADQIEAVFRPFEQLGNAVDCSGGTGLGLSITRQIVDMMRGDIHVESAPGRGSRFTIDALFPMAVQTSPLQKERGVLQIPAPTLR